MAPPATFGAAGVAGDVGVVMVEDQGDAVGQAGEALEITTFGPADPQMQLTVNEDYQQWQQGFGGDGEQVAPQGFQTDDLALVVQDQGQRMDELQNVLTQLCDELSRQQQMQADLHEQVMRLEQSQVGSEFFHQQFHALREEIDVKLNSIAEQGVTLQPASARSAELVATPPTEEPWQLPLAAVESPGSTSG